MQKIIYSRVGKNGEYIQESFTGYPVQVKAKRERLIKFWDALGMVSCSKAQSI